MGNGFFSWAAAVAASVGTVPCLAAEPTAYERAVAATATMAHDRRAQAIATKHGLSIGEVTWEDTGRNKNSVWGPNISDMSIQVHVKGPDGKVARAVTMPVIRYPNFADRTADIRPGQFRVLVGNERGRDRLTSVTLSEYVANLRDYLTRADSWTREASLFATRDSRVLVSAQVSFLPIPRGAEATFNPVLFNYQSSEKNPAVLAIVATREGTSATVIDNKRDAFENRGAGVWGQRLFFNANGQRASLTGRRQSDFAREGGDVGAPRAAANGESGLNMVLLVQIPLKHKERPMAFGGVYKGLALESAAPRGPGIENAVIGHGALEGPFTEIDGLPIERDERFPIRVTVQFYKATEDASVTDADIAAMKAQIDRVYANTAYVGSLVTEGQTGRITEHQGPRWYPPRWWGGCWRTYTEQTGISRRDGMSRLREAYGDDWQRFTGSQAQFEGLLKTALATHSGAK